MAFCGNCGMEIDNRAVVCPNCGVPTSTFRPIPVTPVGKPVTPASSLLTPVDNPVTPAGSPMTPADSPMTLADSPTYSAGSPISPAGGPAYPDGSPVYGSPVKDSTADGSESFGWAVLGFFIPLVGLILYLVWMHEYPLDAKAAGKGALWSVIVSAALIVLFVILGLSRGFMSRYF